MRKIEKKKSCIWVGTIIGTLILLFVFQKIFVFFQLEQHTEQAEMLMKKSEYLIADSYSAIAYLQQLNGNCNADDMEDLRYITNKYRYIYDAGIVNNGHIACTAREGQLTPAVGLPSSAFALNPDISFYRYVSFYPGVAGMLNAIRAKNIMLVTSPFFYQDRIYDNDKYLSISFRSKNKQHILYQRTMSAERPSLLMAQETVSACSDVYNSCVDITDAGMGILRYQGWVQVAVLGCAILLALMITNLILDSLVEHYSLENRLRRAVLRNLIVNRYQPIVDAGQGKIVGAEVLVRWEDEVFHTVSPEFFIPLVEKLGYSQHLTLNILHNALQELAPLLKQYKFTLSINVGSVEVVNRQFVPSLNKIVDQFGISRGRIKIEVTERTDVAYQQLSCFVHYLHVQGYKIAIDDFGTGTSNLHLLPELNFDDVKIDKFYVQRMADENFRKILSNMVSSIIELDKNIIFEGVESEDDLRHIQSIQPHPLVQGWYFYHALSASGLAETMAEHGIPVSESPARR
nr:EAL domain-containing protein [Shimwellia pseudoproteus]